MAEGRRAVVTGLGWVTPLGCDLDTVWARMLRGESGVRPISKFDASAFDSRIAGEVADFDVDRFIPRKEQRRMDPFCHYGLAAAKMAVADAGLDFSREDPWRAGVLMSSGIGGLYILFQQTRLYHERGPSRFSPFMIPQMITNMLPGLVAIEFGLRGPNFAVVSACATGTHSIGEALRAIREDEADIIIAGGSEAAVMELGLGGFCAMKALSTRNDDPVGASRPFDRDRDGFVIGEGAGALVIEEYGRAARRGARIYCEVAGYGATCDAFHITAPDERGAGAAEAMRRAMATAGVSPDEVDYINAHGTSTQLNDRCETLAIKAALGESAARRTMISSTKSMIGHLLGAAGGVESAACALAIHRGAVPPTINQQTPDPECDLDYVPNQAREARVRVCLKNSLGFGGHNATLCFKAV